MLVSIIIPVYNEKKTILDILDNVKASDTRPFEKEIIAVDDASADGTGKVLDDCARDGSITVVHLEKQSGKGSAIKAALNSATGDIVLVQDADLEYSPNDYSKILSLFTDESTKVVYGSRFMRRPWPENMRIPHWMANKVFTFLMNLLYGAHITDEGTCYKAFRRDLLQSLDIRSSGFEFCPEVTAKLLKKDVEIKEVPISYKARDKKEGKKPGTADGLRILWTIIKYRLAS